MALRRPWTERVREMTSDGPIEYRKVLAEAAALVHPGQAYRHGLACESRRVSQFPKHIPLSRTEIIREGREHIAAKAIWDAAKGGRVSLSTDASGTTWLGPGTKPWLVYRTKNSPTNGAVGRPLTPWTSVIRSTLQRGPVKLSKMLAEAMPLVPAERGVEVAMTNRRNIAKHRGGNASYPDSPAKMEKAAATGRRMVVMWAIYSLVRDGRVELYDEDGERWLRAGPRPWN